MGKTIEQYLAGLTGEQMRAAVLKFWAQAGGQETGVETLERWRAGQLSIRFEEINAQQAAPARQPLVGTVVKVLHLNPYKAKDFAAAVRLGKFDNARDLADLIRQFSDDEMGLKEAVDIHLVQFDRKSWHEERLAWGKENAKKPMVNKHLLGIGIQHPEERCQAPIVEDGSVQDGHVLCLLDGDSIWRRLGSGTVAHVWDRDCLFGFVSE